jgi:hypothetical protein
MTQALFQEPILVSDGRHSAGLLEPEVRPKRLGERLIERGFLHGDVGDAK